MKLRPMKGTLVPSVNLCLPRRIAYFWCRPMLPLAVPAGVSRHAGAKAGRASRPPTSRDCGDYGGHGSHKVYFHDPSVGEMGSWSQVQLPN